jgi:hypothetical protein
VEQEQMQTERNNNKKIKMKAIFRLRTDKMLFSSRKQKRKEITKRKPNRGKKPKQIQGK